MIALAATLGSLFFSEVSDFIPCRLCWFQRIAMYPLVIILLVGAIRRDRGAVYYALAVPDHRHHRRQLPQVHRDPSGGRERRLQDRRAVRDEVDQRVRVRDDPRPRDLGVRGDPRPAAVRAVERRAPRHAAEAAEDDDASALGQPGALALEGDE